MTPEQIRRAVLALPTAVRRDLVAKVAADLVLTDRVTTQADWLSFRLNAALSHRWRKA